MQLHAGCLQLSIVPLKILRNQFRVIILEAKSTHTPCNITLGYCQASSILYTLWPVLSETPTGVDVSNIRYIPIKETANESVM